MKKTITLLLSSCLYLTNVSGQNEIPLSRRDSTAAPDQFRKGKIIDVFSWSDKAGENILVLTADEKYIFGDGMVSFENARIYTYGYLMQDKKVKSYWQSKRVVEGCTDSVDVRFIKEFLAVTDLNQDGIGEVWVASKRLCGQSRMNTAELRIEMRQGKEMTVIQGSDKIGAADDTWTPGQYEIYGDVEPVPQVYKDYALSTWKRLLEVK